LDCLMEQNKKTPKILLYTGVRLIFPKIGR